MKEEGAVAINTVPLGVPWQEQTGARMLCPTLKPGLGGGPRCVLSSWSNRVILRLWWTRVFVFGGDGGDVGRSAARSGRST